MIISHASFHLTIEKTNYKQMKLALFLFSLTLSISQVFSKELSEEKSQIL